jgi:hypothetical protein
MLPELDFGAIVSALSTLAPVLDSGSHVFEVRGLTAYKNRTLAGFFNDPILAANEIKNADHPGIKGWYVTLNPVHPDALLRVPNHISSAAYGMLTSDSEILYRAELLIDIDPIRGKEVRIKGVSSTEEEHDLAISVGKEIAMILTRDHGFPRPCIIDSGNGCHLRYKLRRVDFPNTDEIKHLLQALLKVLAKRFNNNKLEIDPTVFNASRISRIPGTIARKGESASHRPHRLARVINDGFDPFDDLDLATVKLLVEEDGETINAPDIRRHIIEYPTDENIFRKLNNEARRRIHEWVPHLLAGLARVHGDGYRISSADLGRDLEEDISILADGTIKDFGVHDLGDITEGRRTPISLLSECIYDGNKRAAAEQLAATLGEPLTDFDSGPLIAPLDRVSQIAPELAPVGEIVTMPQMLVGGTNDEIAEPFCFVEIMHKPKKELEFMIDGFIPFDTHTALSGPPKQGKTTLAYKFVLHALFGRQIFGRGMTVCNVLYVALEERDWRQENKIKDMFKHICDTEWHDMTEQEATEGFARFYYWNLASKKRDGKKYRLPMGFEGAESIREFIRKTDTTRPWLVVIEPVNRFHMEGTTRNLNMQEYEQIENVNAIVSDDGEYVCAVLSVKHDRKAPAGGDKGNIMDRISGSVAQQGAVDAQIQLYTKSHYNFDGVAWLIMQSRDVGKLQIPLISDTVTWDTPPPDMEIPDFEDYVNQVDVAERKARDPKLYANIQMAIAQSRNGLTTKDLCRMFNVGDPTMRRAIDKLIFEEVLVIEDEKRLGAIVYKLAQPVSLPSSSLPDLD